VAIRKYVIEEGKSLTGDITMTTTSGNIAGTIQPFAVAGSGTRPWPYGKAKIYRVDDLKPGKKKKKKKEYSDLGMLYVGTMEDMQEAYTVRVGDPKDNMWKIPKLGKVGVWRTVRGRRYFFPVDGSGPIPKVKGSEGKAVGKNLHAKKPEKKGLLKRMMGLLGGGGGAKASLKDVKPKGGKAADSKGGESAGGGEAAGSEASEKVASLIAKAGQSKSGKKVMPALKAMQSAMKSGNAKALKKAESKLAKATQKLAKR